MDYKEERVARLEKQIIESERSRIASALKLKKKREEERDARRKELMRELPRFSSRRARLNRKIRG